MTVPTILQTAQASSPGGNMVWGSPLTPGSLCLLMYAKRNLSPASCFDSSDNTRVYTSIATAAINAASPRGAEAMFRRTVAGDTQTWSVGPVGIGLGIELSGASIDTFATLDDQNTSALVCGGPVTPSTTFSRIFGLGAIGEFDPVNDYSVTPGPGVTELQDAQLPGVLPLSWVGYTASGGQPGGTIVTGTGRYAHCGITVAVVCDT